MVARLRKLLDDLREQFWLLPAGFVLAGAIAAALAIAADRSKSEYLGILAYDGGTSAARGPETGRGPAWVRSWIAAVSLPLDRAGRL